MKSVFVLFTLFCVAFVSCNVVKSPRLSALPLPPPPSSTVTGLSHHQKHELNRFVKWVRNNAEDIPLLSNYTLSLTFDPYQMECINKVSGLSTEAEYKDFAATYLTQIYQRLCVGLLHRAGSADNQVCYGIRSRLEVESYENETFATFYVTNAPSNILQLKSSLVTKILAEDMYTAMYLQTNSNKLYAALKCTQ